MPQRLGHPQPGFPDDLQNQDDHDHLSKEGQRRPLLGRRDLVQQLGRDQLGQVDRQADEHPRQKDGQIERAVFQHPQKGREKGGGGVIVQALKVLGKEGGQDQRRRAAVDQDHQLALAELGRGHRRPLGVADRGEQPVFRRQQPGHKIAGIQQQLGPGVFQNAAHLGHHLPVRFAAAVAQGVLGLHGRTGLGHLHHEILAADQPPQQAQVDPQQVGKALPAAPEVALPRGLAHRAELQALDRKGDPLPAAVQQEDGEPCRQQLDRLLAGAHRPALGRQSGMVEQPLKDLLAAGGRQAGKLVGPVHGVQQQMPQGREAGHAVK